MRRCTGLAIVGSLYFMSSLPSLPAAERASLAAKYRFERVNLFEEPAELQSKLRPVHPSYEHVAAWVSSLGAAVALADIDSDGLPDDIAWVDTRTNQVYVGVVPGSPRDFETFALFPKSPNSTVAPMGCVPADLNEDGRLDLLIYFWGRAPLAFLRKPTHARLDADAFIAQDIAAPDEVWNTNAVTSADFDGDGHLDLYVGNYFADGSRLLDESAEDQAEFPLSMSRACNGGRNRFFLWESATQGANPSVNYRVCPEDSACGSWTLAAGAADLDGDLLPELYVGNDFGPDQLLHNRSTPGNLKFVTVRGERNWSTPASKVLGRDSFKGMGVGFADLNNDGWLDIYVSNITTEYGLQESQFLFLSTGRIADFGRGIAPYVDASEALGLSRSSWAWDARLVDLDNDGVHEALQAVGFMSGEVNRWPELHEAAMGNDQLLARTALWHHMRPGDDLTGEVVNPFFVRASDGRYYDLARDVGLDLAECTRAIAIADVDGDGDLDWAVGNQWQASAFLRNETPAAGSFLGLRLLLPVRDEDASSSANGWVSAGRPASSVASRPAIGAAVELRLPTGEQRVAQVDGGNGHSGVCSPELHFGLGDLASDAELFVRVRWRDGAGGARQSDFELAPGWHTIYLGAAHE